MPHEELDKLFRLAGFRQSDATPRLYIREFESLLSGRTWQDGTPDRIQRAVRATVDPNGVHFTLLPGIASHTDEQHEMAALGASILFKLAMTLGERYNAKVIQMLLRGPCLPANYGEETKVLADYAAEMPLRFENLCEGFQRVLLHGIGDATRGAYDGQEH